jgi:hypothetical protein
LTILNAPLTSKGNEARNFDIFSVSGCISRDFADYIDYWKHNGYWLFDSPEIIKSLAKENSIQLEGTSLFYYEAYEMEFRRGNLASVCTRAVISYERAPAFHEAT